jgi:hypothetical protein
MEMSDYASEMDLKIEAKAVSLRANMVRLQEDMEESIRRLDEAMEKAPAELVSPLNNLGIVQSVGHEIDRQCGELHVLCDLRAGLKLVR